jgi:hypothetical protein
MKIIFKSKIILALPFLTIFNIKANDIYLEAGMCIGFARALEAQFPSNFNELSEVAKSNINKIKINLNSFDKWIPRRNECYISNTNLKADQLNSCLVNKISDPNAVKFWYGYTLAGSFSNNKSKHEVINNANATCVTLKEIPRIIGGQMDGAKITENKISGGQIKIILQSVKKAGKNTCELFFEIENKTSYNITSMNFTTTFRGNNNSILGMNILQTKILPPNVKVDGRQYAMDIPCSNIKNLKLNPLELLFVDGKSRRDLLDSVNSLITTSSASDVKFDK